MVAHVVLAQLLPELGLRHEVVDVVVGVVVDQVAEDEAGEEGEAGVAEDQPEGEQEEPRQRDRDRGRHHQAHAVVRVVVVDAVDDEVHTATDRVVGLPVEDEAVQPVLGQGPDRCSGQGQQDQLPDRVAAVDPQPLHRDDHRDEDDSRDRGVDPGEEIESNTWWCCHIT